jgi:phospholipid/cholesterol/gamma-HCH transport system ATP-binding protein
MANKILCVENLVTSIGGSVLHDHLDLDLYEGEILGLVGGSGSGKSVLLRVILGLIKASSGTVTSYSREGNPSQSLQEMGVLFQSGALFSSLSVGENIQIPLREKANLSPQLCQEIALMKMAMVGLPLDAYHKYPGELSGGMIKRAALARSLAMDPRLLFLDEPTAGLDPIGAQGFDELILSLRERLNLSVLMVTHDLDSLVTICDRIAVLIDKKLVVGTLDELYQHPHPWIQSYFLGKRGRMVKKLPSTT